ncbi:FecR family protein [Geomesophilobacter sediminis]|uniref:FecR domain-containing protein n=1 Tax=Geomesophilobacter sediminis TaxID=2798584 RepID=A0A8J7LUE8_9BACT|nr:FecR domain-containing protein [Geomesophilobacter sediminis]MBJ6724559.1 FecR domain-containing protein [Geomesophilobacter sediminis]
MRYLALLVMAVVVWSGSCAYGASDHIGIVKTVSGEVSVVRGGRSIAADPNFRLQEGDVIRTGPSGKAGLILEDDTVISLGPGSSIAITNFLFQPNERKLSLVARVLQGTISYLSGQIAKLMPSAVRLETPRATVGVRGTHVLIEVD